jgi:4-hydroxybenzoate polyprenyl transferase
MKNIKNFIELTRLNKPTGFMLLFWPCSWGLALAFFYNQDLEKFLHFFFLFLCGSILMRSAGCIVNDIVDRNIDKKVKRTRNRPLANGSISISLALIYVFILCLISLIILLQFNYLTITLGLVSMFFAFSYPFMKRITYWPQLFLGLTFNWGVVMAWVAVNNSISFEIIILYIAAIFWTLGYDTIYGNQDVVDDEIIGIKSTSVKFKNNIKIFVSICYSFSSILILYLFNSQFGLNNFTLLTIIFILSLMYQIKKLKKNNPEKCLQAFKLNNFSGFLLFMGIFLIK